MSVIVKIAMLNMTSPINTNLCTNFSTCVNVLRVSKVCFVHKVISVTLNLRTQKPFYIRKERKFNDTLIGQLKCLTPRFAHNWTILFLLKVVLY